MWSVFVDRIVCHYLFPLKNVCVLIILIDKKKEVLYVIYKLISIAENWKYKMTD